MIIKLVEAHYNKDNDAFTNICYQLSQELYKGEKNDIANHILAQTSDNLCWNICDPKPFTILLNGWCKGKPIDKGMYLIVTEDSLEGIRRNDFMYSVDYWYGRGFYIYEQSSVIAWKKVSLYEEVSNE